MPATGCRDLGSKATKIQNKNISIIGVKERWKVPYLPADRLHFFYGKRQPKLGVRLIRGYKPLEVINMHDFQRSNIDFERSNIKPMFEIF